MESILRWLIFIALLSTLLPWWRARAAVRNTTLVSAWRWMAAGLIAATSAAAGDLFAPAGGRGYVELLWYAAALLLLCPAIAVLGAQRPVARVWTWFVVLPFLLVFGWPAGASWRPILSTGHFDLETPMAVGFAFVVVMGLGNYVGTRFTFPALLHGTALVLMVLPLATAQFSWLPDIAHSRLGAALMISGALWWAERCERLDAPVRIPLDRVWIEFRDRFGIVWSKRILDRLNHMAANDRLIARMGLTGVVAREGNDVPPPDDVAQLERSLRWLLRRFVDDAWIDEQLRRGSETAQHVAQPSPDAGG